MKLFNLLSLTLLLQLAAGAALQYSAAVLGPRSESSPNPIASLYPNQVTGTINGTLSVVPIPYDLARSIIPAQYGILTGAYKSLLKGFPENSYPLIIRGAFDHAVRVYSVNYSLADFQRIEILYPFVDLLNDGYSSFAYNSYLLITSTNTIAILGAEADGTLVAPATFVPDLEAYAYTPTVASSTEYISLNAFTLLSLTQPAVTTLFKTVGGVGPWPLNFYQNVTNQPIFTDGTTCDNQINLFNTTLSTGSNAPAGIKGNITVMPPYFPAGDWDCNMFDGVHGIKVDIAFVENPSTLCANLKGYHASGSGD